MKNSSHNRQECQNQQKQRHQANNFINKQLNSLQKVKEQSNKQFPKIDLKMRKLVSQKKQFKFSGINRFVLENDANSTASSDEQQIKKIRLHRYKTQCYQIGQNSKIYEEAQNIKTKKQHFVNKLLNVMYILQKLFPLATIQKIILKLNSHLGQLLSSDKYIRMVYSIMKLYRSINSMNSLQVISKQLLLTRRVIRWQSKYQAVRQIMNPNNQILQKFFILFQLTGDMFDLLAFWFKLFHDKFPNLKSWAQIFTNIESDFYFYECCIWFIRYGYRFSSNIIQLLNLEISPQSDDYQANIQYRNKNHKERKKIKKQIKLNGLRLLKYVFDCRTSYHNYSKKVIELSPIVGSVYGILSSSIGIYLLWQ